MINSFEREMLAEPWQYINKELEFADDFATACQIAVKYIEELEAKALEYRKTYNYIDELEAKAAEYRATIDRLRDEWPKS